MLPQCIQVLWCLLSSVCWCAALEEESCVLGVVGWPVSLPCFSSALLTSGNFSIEWWRDDQAVLRSMWEAKGNIRTWSLNRATIPSDATLTGNFSLVLPAVHPRDDRKRYNLSFTSGENQSIPLCSVCLRVAASFSEPQLRRDRKAEGDKTTFQCHSSGGYPQPAVSWLINNTQEPPQGSVRTQTATLPDGHLYNITSNLTISTSKDVSVTCIVENLSMNETLRSTYKPNGDLVGNRVSESIWIFSTALCVMVGLMVIAGVVYQIHLDRLNKKRKQEYREPQRGYKKRWQYRQEAEAMKDESKETDL